MSIKKKDIRRREEKIYTCIWRRREEKELRREEKEREGH
jgi:hypothetical protein